MLKNKSDINANKIQINVCLKLSRLLIEKKEDVKYASILFDLAALIDDGSDETCRKDG